MRLVAGLKRYFHEKRAQGLLTGRGILVLDHACDAAMDASSDPLLIWAIVERCSLRLLCTGGPAQPGPRFFVPVTKVNAPYCS